VRGRHLSDRRISSRVPGEERAVTAAVASGLAPLFRPPENLLNDGGLGVGVVLHVRRRPRRERRLGRQVQLSVFPRGAQPVAERSIRPIPAPTDLARAKPLRKAGRPARAGLLRGCRTRDSNPRHADYDRTLRGTVGLTTPNLELRRMVVERRFRRVRDHLGTTLRLTVSGETVCSRDSSNRRLRSH